MAASRLNIALVITELEVGGAERCLANLALGLARREQAVTVYALGPRPRPPRDELVEQLENAGIPVHFLGFTRSVALPWAVQSLTRCLRSQRPDVIQAMLFHANVVAGLARRRLGHGVMVMGLRVADPSGWRRWVERRIALRADGVACVSQQVAQFAVDRVGIDPGKLAVIPNGVDVSCAATRQPLAVTQLGVAPGRRIMVCVARLAVQKGLDRLIDAAPALLARVPTHDLVVVGDGPERQQLQRAAAAGAAAGRIHFVGWRHDVWEILLASDLLLLPSRWEGMPNVVLEAMACRLPVVCTRAEGVCELLGPLAPQQTAPIDNFQDFVDKAVAIVCQPQLADQIGTENRYRVERLFSLDAMVHSYARLFESLSNPL